MGIRLSNNAQTTLASAITSTDTSITVVDGSVFPALSGSDYTYVTLEDTSGNLEVVKVTAISSNTLTVTRGQDSTTARAFSSGDFVQLRVTAALLNDIADEASVTLWADVQDKPDPVITLAGDATGSATLTDLGSATLTVTIADDSHNHVISNVDGLQTALNAKQDASTALTTSNYSTTLDGRYYTETEVGTFFSGASAITGYNKTNWDTAYGWGNHASAGYLTGNQTITLTGDVSGSGTTSIAVTIADDSHNHVISNVDGLQTALDSKLASSSYTAADVLTKIKTVDGSGSGLDADLFDGVQSTGYHTVTSSPSTPGNGVLSIGNNGTYSYVQSHNSQPLRLNPVGNALQGPNGSTIWHSGNDGASSGLDADLLDGVQGSSYLRSDQSDTMSGTLAITHTNLAAEPYSGLTITNTSTSGTYYTGVTIDAVGQAHYRYKLNGALKWQTRVGAGNGTDDFRVYSWTGAADVLLGNPSGQWTASGDFRAPIFYDSQDTSYYTDPPSLSNINALTATRIGVNPSGTSTNGFGISLYGGYNSGEPTYGLMFQGRGTFGGHGPMGASDWATYFTMNNDTSRGWIFRRAGSGNSASITAGGLATFDDSVRTPIFYDSNNTGYYVDPASSGVSANFNGRIQVGTFTQSQTNSGEAWIGRAADRSQGVLTVQLGGGAGRRFEVVDSGWTTVEFSADDAGIATAAGSMRAPLFYDNNNTSYYVDPASSSVLQGTVTINGNDNQLKINGTSGYKAAGIFFAQDGSNKWEHYYHSGLLRFYNYTQARQEMSISDSGYVEVVNDFRAPIFYDSNNTGYYVDPAGATSAKFAQFVQIGDSSSYGTNSGNWGARLNVTDNVHAKIEVGQDANGMLSHWYAHTGQSSVKFGTSSSHDLEIQRAGTTEIYLYPGYAQARAQMRAPIFYDSNDTGYYVDPASTSRLNAVNFTNLYYAVNTNYGFIGQNVYADTINSGIASDALELCYYRGAYTTTNGSMRAPLFYDSLDTGFYVDPSAYTRLKSVARTNTRVSNSQKHPVGHYSPGEAVFEIDPTWDQNELQEFFGSTSVVWSADSTAPGGYAIYIGGSVGVGGHANSGFPYIPVDQDDEFYMECWIKNAGSGQRHYMGSNEYNESFSSLGGNPGSYGYWVMSNTDPGSSWTKVSGYIGGFSNNVGDFESGTKYWTPQALFNYGAGTGTRACYISGWKVYRVKQQGNRNFVGNVQAYQFQGNANVAGTGNASYHPSGIYSTGNNWLYGTIYRNGSHYYSQGGDIYSTNRIVCDNNYGEGVFGVYSSYRYQHVWMMSTSYKLASDGTSVGNAYGISWTHTNVGTGTNQAISGLSHQMQIRAAGDLWCALGNGIWTVGNVTAYSDISVKTNLEVIPDALAKVCQLNGYTYDRTDYKADPLTGEMPETRQAGVVAQEVEKVLPEVVSGEEGNKAVAYGNMVALLIEAIKEQQTQIEAMAAEIKSLKEMKQ